MALSMEYTRKIRRFLEVIPKRMYTKFDNVIFQGFVTRDRLSFEEALAHEKSAFNKVYPMSRTFSFRVIKILDSEF